MNLIHIDEISLKHINHINDNIAKLQKLFQKTKFFYLFYAYNDIYKLIDDFKKQNDLKKKEVLKIVQNVFDIMDVLKIVKNAQNLAKKLFEHIACRQWNIIKDIINTKNDIQAQQVIKTHIELIEKYIWGGDGHFQTKNDYDDYKDENFINDAYEFFYYNFVCVYYKRNKIVDVTLICFNYNKDEGIYTLDNIIIKKQNEQKDKLA